jgi:uncharacterized protein
MKKSEITYVDLVVVVLIFAGPFIWWSTQSVSDGFRTPEFADRGLIALIVTELLLASLALGYLLLRLGSLKQFGFTVSWRETGWGAALYLIAFVAWMIAYSIGARLLPGDDVMQRASAFASMSLLPIAAMSIVNGIYEEFFLVRFLLESLARHGAWFAIGVSSLVRIAYHFYQGPQGAVFALVFGVVVSVFYWRYRVIWPVMVAHITADIVGLLNL